MHRVLFLFPYFVVHIALFSQNLIPNPGFDSITVCPENGGFISYAPPWESAGWSPDLFNECSTNLYPNVPHPISPDNYQPARSGGGYAGIYVYDMSGSDNEYIRTPLLDPLENGKMYFVQFFVSPSFFALNQIYSDAVGLAFSENENVPNRRLDGSMPLLPAIEHSGTLIKDTTNWVEVSGCYQAKGTENYGLIGNFRSDAETNVEIMGPSFGNYFFIEDVGIWMFDPLPDTVLLCVGASRTFDASFLDATYEWNTGSTLPSIEVSNSGIYIVTAQMRNCALRDTMVVIDSGLPEFFPADTLICMGQSVTLTAPLPGKFDWSSGAVTPKIAVQQAGTYSLTISNACGEFEFESEVRTQECGCKVYVPNVFSRNDDGDNGFLSVRFGCDYLYRVLRFQVFDRWGNLVFSTTKPEQVYWDAQRANIGVYAWVLEYEINDGAHSEVLLKTGDVTVIQ
ncbi:MAG: gliding motility-associated C-terminal domain-containing protein [Saprospiraceae bacterium]